MTPGASDSKPGQRLADGDPTRAAVEFPVNHVRRMTPAQIRRSLIAAGMLTRSGQLADPYG
jgi:hypothetical protein